MLTRHHYHLPPSPSQDSSSPRSSFNLPLPKRMRPPFHFCRQSKIKLPNHLRFLLENVLLTGRKEEGIDGPDGLIDSSITRLQSTTNSIVCIKILSSHAVKIIILCVRDTYIYIYIYSMRNEENNNIRR